MVCQMWRNTLVLPVKWMPAKSLCLKMTSPAVGPSTWMRLMTPPGSPAALKISMITWAL